MMYDGIIGGVGGGYYLGGEEKGEEWEAHPYIYVLYTGTCLL